MMSPNRQAYLPSIPFTLNSKNSDPRPQAPVRFVNQSQPTDNCYFGDSIYESPVGSDDEDRFVNSPDEDDEDADSDSTCEDDDTFSQFGHPLERMPRVNSADHGSSYDADQQVTALLKVSMRSTPFTSRSSSFSSVASTLSYDSVDYEELIDHMLEEGPSPFLSCNSRNLAMFKPRSDSTMKQAAQFLPPLMAKQLLRSSSELLLLLELNHPDLREDPWNPIPHTLCGVERDKYIYICMQGLYEYNDPPFRIVAHYIDFFRQVLEGLSFLHEQQIVGLSCSDPTSYMVDLNSAPRTPAPLENDTNSLPQRLFDRSAYPVRYYFVNLSKATRISNNPSSRPMSPQGNLRAQATAPFKIDVQDCGNMFNELLADVPQIATKFRSLIKAMTVGGFTADDSRRLFEALCRSLDAHAFESKASHRPMERAQPISYPISAGAAPATGYPPLKSVSSD